MASAGQSGVLGSLCVLVKFYCVLAQFSGSDDWRNSAGSPSNQTAHSSQDSGVPLIYIVVLLLILLAAVLAVLCVTGWIGYCYMWFKRSAEVAGTHGKMLNNNPQTFRRSRSRSTITSSSTIHQSPLFTSNHGIVNPTLALKLSHHGSDLSAIAASGKWNATRKYQSNPELKINNLSVSERQAGNLKTEELYFLGGRPVKGSEREPCYAVSYESHAEHFPVNCTSDTSLHSCSTAVSAVGRIQSGWQHN